MEAFKKILYLVPIALVFLFLIPILFGDMGENNWYSENQMSYILLFCGFILFSGIGYYINRSKSFGKKMLKWHIWTTYFGIILILIGIAAHYYFDAQIFEKGLDIAHFKESKIKFLALIFFAAALLVIGFCAYLINMLISNYTQGENDS